MSSKNKALVSGAIAAVIAIALISGLVLTTGLLPKSTTLVSSTTTSGGSTQRSGSGTWSVLMTDPPTVPDGTTAVYINYSDVQVHVSQDGNNSGWTDLQSSGTINLMSILNSTQTIAAANITSGVFNGLRFNVTGAVVT